MVNAAAFSPDGKTVVTGMSIVTEAGKTEKGIPKRGRHGEIHFWETATGRAIGSPTRLPGEVDLFLLAFSPDGARLLAGGDGVVDGRARGEVRLWDAATREPVGAPLRHAGTLSGATFSRDGRVVLTRAGAESGWGEARLWDAATGTPVGGPFTVEAPPDRVAFCPDLRTVFIAKGNAARLWDVATARPIGPPLEHAGRVAAVAWSPDGSRLLVSGDKTTRLWAAPPPPVGGEVERVVLWTQVLTGMELTEHGSVRLIEAGAWHDRRRRLEHLGGPPLGQGGGIPR
jgi:WD40 repeat protein